MDDYNMESQLEKLEQDLLGGSVGDFVIDKAREWREHYEEKYQERFEEYYRLWRGQFSESDRERKNERSKLVTPALQQAVESNVAEVEEATFGRGQFFDIKDDINDEDPRDVAYLKEALTRDFKKTKIRQAVSEVLINAAVYGTGMAEIVIEDAVRYAPATEVQGSQELVGVRITSQPVVRLRPILPQNFLIDPVATTVDEALGVCIEEYVPKHQVERLMEEGIYADKVIDTVPLDTEIEPDQDDIVYQSDKVLLRKYYGLVPTYLLQQCELLSDEEEDALDTEKAYTEAVVVLAGNTLLKCNLSPYMMQDRPVVAFPWDVVPGRFWGRGVCEKGYNSQKALDAEIRGRIDALAMTVHPMMAIDATRIPRGHTPTIQPGKILLTQGDPKDVLNPFNFGSVDQITFAQASALQQMVQQATGAVDSAGIAGQVNGEATAAGISMSLGAIIKRHKRTLINFQECFLIPFVEKAAWRYMQFDPDRYPVKDYEFCATSTLGIIAREYEVTQLTQLLQTMPPESPVYNVLVQSIVDNMNLSNREEIVAMIQQSMQPDPEAQARAQEQQELQNEMTRSQIAVLKGEAAKSKASSVKTAVEARMLPIETQIDMIQAITQDLKDDQEDKSFDKRLAVMDRRINWEKVMTDRQKSDDQSRIALMRELTRGGNDNSTGNATSDRPGQQGVRAGQSSSGGAGASRGGPGSRGVQAPSASEYTR